MSQKVLLKNQKNILHIFDNKSFSLAQGLGLSAIVAFVLQFFSETVRQDGFLPVFGWILPHFVPFMAGTVAVFLAVAILFVLLRRLWAATAIIGIMLFVGTYASFFKQAYRGDPVLPADILLAKDAAGIAGGMDLSPTPYMILFAVVLVVACVVLFSVRLSRFSVKTAVLPALGLVCGLAVWMPCVLWYGGIPAALKLNPIAGRASSVYHQGGFTTGFLSYLGHISPKKPVNYSSENTAKALQQLPPQKPLQSTPDIVVVMLESYYHLDNYPTAVGCENLTQYYDELSKEGVSGIYYSDKYSGGTADMEFGALTGFSTSFLPDGIVPYIQYVSKTPSFPSYPTFLKEQGYQTIAIHPFDGSIYHRSSAYPNMGFDTFIDRTTMEYTELAGKYIADQQAAKELISQYETAVQSGSPVFLHMVTMQNHIPNLPEEYETNYRANVNIEGISEYYNESFKSVATGLRDADLMMKQITDYFRTVDREVIVLFFGDHQTAIGQDNGVELLDVTHQLDALSEQEHWQALHKVPYLMWSNKGCKNPGTDGGTFPPYLLMPTFLTEMDAPITPWFEWLYKSRDVLMGTSAGRILHTDGSISEAISAQEEETLNLQHTLQYKMMFDK